MKIESQVCSLELAKRLKELGVKQDSIFYWEDTLDVTPTLWSLENNPTYFKEGGRYTFSAFTVADLGQMLPLLCEVVKMREDAWRIEYQSPAQSQNNRIFWQRESFKAATEADARAKMLIHLIEQKIVKP